MGIQSGKHDLPMLPMTADELDKKIRRTAALRVIEINEILNSGTREETVEFLAMLDLP